MKMKSYDAVDTDLGEHVEYSVKEYTEGIIVVHDERSECRRIVCDKQVLEQLRSVSLYSAALGKIITRPITVEGNDDLFELPAVVDNVWRPPEEIITVDEEDDDEDDECFCNNPQSASVNDEPFKNSNLVPLKMNCCKKQTKVVVCVECGSAYHRKCFVWKGGALQGSDGRITCCGKPRTDLEIENELRKKIIREMDEKCEIMRENRELLKARVVSLEKNNIPRDELVRDLMSAMNDKCKVLTENKALLHEKILSLEKGNKREVPVENAVSLFQKLISSDIFKKCSSLLETDSSDLNIESQRINNDDLINLSKELIHVNNKITLDNGESINQLNPKNVTDNKNDNLPQQQTSQESITKKSLNEDIVSTNESVSKSERISVRTESRKGRFELAKKMYSQRARRRAFRSFPRSKGNLVKPQEQMSYLKHTVKAIKRKFEENRKVKKVERSRISEGESECELNMNTTSEDDLNKTIEGGPNEKIEDKLNKTVEVKFNKGSEDGLIKISEDQSIKTNENKSIKINEDKSSKTSEDKSIKTSEVKLSKTNEEELNKTEENRLNKRNEDKLNKTGENKSSKVKEDKLNKNRDNKFDKTIDKDKQYKTSESKLNKTNKSRVINTATTSKATTQADEEIESGIKTPKQKPSKTVEELLNALFENQSPKENISPETQQNKSDKEKRKIGDFIKERRKSDLGEAQSKESLNNAKEVSSPRDVSRISSPKNLDEIINKIQNRKKSPLKTKMINTALIKSNVATNKSGKFDNKNEGSKKRKLSINSPHKEHLINSMSLKKLRLNLTKDPEIAKMIKKKTTVKSNHEKSELLEKAVAEGDKSEASTEKSECEDRSNLKNASSEKNDQFLDKSNLKKDVSEKSNQYVDKSNLKKDVLEKTDRFVDKSKHKKDVSESQSEPNLKRDTSEKGNYCGNKSNLKNSSSEKSDRREDVSERTSKKDASEKGNFCGGKSNLKNAASDQVPDKSGFKNVADHKKDTPQKGNYSGNKFNPKKGASECDDESNIRNNESGSASERNNECDGDSNHKIAVSERLDETNLKKSTSERINECADSSNLKKYNESNLKKWALERSNECADESNLKNCSSGRNIERDDESNLKKPVSERPDETNLKKGSSERINEYYNRLNFKKAASERISLSDDKSASERINKCAHNSNLKKYASKRNIECADESNLKKSASKRSTECADESNLKKSASKRNNERDDDCNLKMTVSDGLGVHVDETNLKKSSSKRISKCYDRFNLKNAASERINERADNSNVKKYTSKRINESNLEKCASKRNIECDDESNLKKDSLKRNIECADESNLKRCAPKRNNERDDDSNLKMTVSDRLDVNVNETNLKKCSSKKNFECDDESNIKKNDFGRFDVCADEINLKKCASEIINESNLKTGVSKGGNNIEIPAVTIHNEEGEHGCFPRSKNEMDDRNESSVVNDGEHIHVDNMHTDDDDSSEPDPNLDESICVKEEIVNSSMLEDECSIEETLVKDEDDFLLDEDTLPETSAVEAASNKDSPEKENREITITDLLSEVVEPRESLSARDLFERKEGFTIKDLLNPKEDSVGQDSLRKSPGFLNRKQSRDEMSVKKLSRKSGERKKDFGTQEILCESRSDLSINDLLRNSGESRDDLLKNVDESRREITIKDLLRKPEGDSSGKETNVAGEIRVKSENNSLPLNKTSSVEKSHVIDDLRQAKEDSSKEGNNNIDKNRIVGKISHTYKTASQIDIFSVRDNSPVNQSLAKASAQRFVNTSTLYSPISDVGDTPKPAEKNAINTDENTANLKERAVRMLNFEQDNLKTMPVVEVSTGVKKDLDFAEGSVKRVSVAGGDKSAYSIDLTRPQINLLQVVNIGNDAQMASAGVSEDAIVLKGKEKDGQSSLGVSRLEVPAVISIEENMDVEEMSETDERLPGILLESKASATNLEQSGASTSSKAIAAQFSSSSSNAKASQFTSNASASQVPSTPCKMNASQFPASPANTTKFSTTSSGANVSPFPSTSSNVNVSQFPSTSSKANTSQFPSTPPNVNIKQFPAISPNVTIPQFRNIQSATINHPSPPKNPVVVRPYCWASRLTCPDSNHEPQPGTSQRRYTIQVRKDLTIGPDNSSLNEDSNSNQDSPRIGSIKVRKDLVQRSEEVGETSGLIQVRKDLIQTTEGQSQVRNTQIDVRSGGLNISGGQIQVRSEVPSGSGQIDLRNGGLTISVGARNEGLSLTPGHIQTRNEGLSLTPGHIQTRNEGLSLISGQIQARNEGLNLITEQIQARNEGLTLIPEQIHESLNLTSGQNEGLSLTPGTRNENINSIDSRNEGVSVNPRQIEVNMQMRGDGLNLPLAQIEPRSLNVTPGQIQVRKDLVQSEPPRKITIRKDLINSGKLKIRDDLLPSETPPKIAVRKDLVQRPDEASTSTAMVGSIKVRKDLQEPAIENLDETPLILPLNLTCEGRSESAQNNENAKEMKYLKVRKDLVRSDSPSSLSSSPEIIPTDDTVNSSNGTDVAKTRWSLKVRKDLHSVSTVEDAASNESVEPQKNLENLVPEAAEENDDDVTVINASSPEDEKNANKKWSIKVRTDLIDSPKSPKETEEFGSDEEMEPLVVDEESPLHDYENQENTVLLEATNSEMLKETKSALLEATNTVTLEANNSVTNSGTTNPKMANETNSALLDTANTVLLESTNSALLEATGSDDGINHLETEGRNVERDGIGNIEALNDKNTESNSPGSANDVLVVSDNAAGAVVAASEAGNDLNDSPLLLNSNDPHPVDLNNSSQLVDQNSTYLTVSKNASYLTGSKSSSHLTGSKSSSPLVDSKSSSFIIDSNSPCNLADSDNSLHLVDPNNPSDSNNPAHLVCLKNPLRLVDSNKSPHLPRSTHSNNPPCLLDQNEPRLSEATENIASKTEASGEGETNSSASNQNQLNNIDVVDISEDFVVEKTCEGNRISISSNDDDVLLINEDEVLKSSDDDCSNTAVEKNHSSAQTETDDLSRVEKDEEGDPENEKNGAPPERTARSETSDSNGEKIIATLRDEAEGRKVAKTNERLILNANEIETNNVEAPENLQPSVKSNNSDDSTSRDSSEDLLIPLRIDEVIDDENSRIKDDEINLRVVMKGFDEDIKEEGVSSDGWDGIVVEEIKEEAITNDGSNQDDLCNKEGGALNNQERGCTQGLDNEKDGCREESNNQEDGCNLNLNDQDQLVVKDFDGEIKEEAITYDEYTQEEIVTKFKEEIKDEAIISVYDQENYRTNSSDNQEGGDCRTDVALGNQKDGNCGTTDIALSNKEGGDFRTSNQEKEDCRITDTALGNQEGGDCRALINREGGDCRALINREEGDCRTIDAVLNNRENESSRMGIASNNQEKERFRTDIPSNNQENGSSIMDIASNNQGKECSGLDIALNNQEKENFGSTSLNNQEGDANNKQGKEDCGTTDAVSNNQENYTHISDLNNSNLKSNNLNKTESSEASETRVISKDIKEEILDHNNSEIGADLMDEVYPKPTNVPIADYIKEHLMSLDEYANDTPSIVYDVSPGLKGKGDMEEGEISNSSGDNLVIDDCAVGAKRKRGRGRKSKKSKSRDDSIISISSSLDGSESCAKKRKKKRKKTKDSNASTKEELKLNPKKKKRRKEKESSAKKRIKVIYDPIDTTLGDEVTFDVETISSCIHYKHEPRGYKKISWDGNLLRSRTRMVEIYIEALDKNITRPITLEANDDVLDIPSGGCGSARTDFRRALRDNSANKGLANGGGNGRKLSCITNDDCDNSISKPSSSKASPEKKDADDLDLMDFCFTLSEENKTKHNAKKEKKTSRRLLRKVDVDKFLDMIHNSRDASF